MSFGSERALDQVDWAILRELQADARLSFSRLAKLVNLSSPAVAERVRRLERDGVITGYEAQVAPATVGLSVSAFVELACDQGKCLLRTTKADDFPEVVEVHKLSGVHCAMLRLRAASLEHLDGAVERLSGHGKVNVSVVLSTEFEGRPVEPDQTNIVRPTPSEGWNSD